MLNFLLLILSKVTFGVMDPLEVNNVLVNFLGLINLDLHVLCNFFA